MRGCPSQRLDEDAEVVVGEDRLHEALGDRLHQDPGAQDDRHLAEPPADGLEEVRALAGRAAQHVPLAGDDVHLHDGVGGEPVPDARDADSGAADHAPDRELRVVRHHPRRQPVGVDRLEELLPARPGLGPDRVPLDGLDAVEAGHVDDDAVLDLRVARHRVPAPPGHDLEPVLAGTADDRHHLLHRAGAGDRTRPAAHHVTPVVRVGGECLGVAVERGHRPFRGASEMLTRCMTRGASIGFERRWLVLVLSQSRTSPSRQTWL